MKEESRTQSQSVGVDEGVPCSGGGEEQTGSIHEGGDAQLPSTNGEEGQLVDVRSQSPVGGGTQLGAVEYTVEPQVLGGASAELPEYKGEQSKDDSQEWLWSKSDQEDWWELTTDYGQEDISFLTSRDSGAPDPVGEHRSMESSMDLNPEMLSHLHCWRMGWLPRQGGQQLHR